MKVPTEHCEMMQDPQHWSIILQAFQKKTGFPNSQPDNVTTSDPPGCIQLPKRGTKTPERWLFTPGVYQSAHIHTKGTQKMQEVAPFPSPSPLGFHSLLSHTHETQQTFSPAVAAPEELTQPYQIHRHQPQLAPLPRWAICKVFWELPVSV